MLVGVPLGEVGQGVQCQHHGRNDDERDGDYRNNLREKRKGRKGWKEKVRNENKI